MAYDPQAKRYTLSSAGCSSRNGLVGHLLPADIGSYADDNELYTVSKPGHCEATR